MKALPLQIHVWPGRWGLPSIDASCIEAILYLQLTFPKCYSIIETADPDLSPSGQLPFLIHGQLAVSSLPSIISYVSGLDASLFESADLNDVCDDEDEPSNGDLDRGLTHMQASQAAAWRAYVEAQLGDLVTHSFFVLDPNYRAFTRDLLASMLPVPQRYYVPNRIKGSYRPRLEGVGLWRLASEPEEAQGDRNKSHPEFTRSFGQMKLIERARLVFDILSRLLDEKSFLLNDRPTAIDLAMASRILILTRAPFPNPTLKEVVETSYPALTAHASRTYTLAFPSSPSQADSMPPILSLPRINSLMVVKRSLIYFGHSLGMTKIETEEVKRFRRYRWGWLGLVVVGVVGFLGANFSVQVIDHAEDEGENSDDVIDNQESDM